MGLIGRVLSFTRTLRNGARVSDVKLDPGGGPNRTAQHFSPAGDDAYPMPGDYLYVGSDPQRGRVSAVGYVDPVNAPRAALGEKRIYARDSSGVWVVEVWLKADGTAAIANASGSVTLKPDGAILGQNGAGQFELEAAGDFVANGAKMTTDGDVVTSDGVSLRSHYHTQGNDSNGDTEADTSAAVATE